MHGVGSNHRPYFIVWATNNAPASVLAPFQYFEIVSAVFLGYLVFEDVPATSTVIGVLIIVVSGVYLFHREHRKPPRVNGLSGTAILKLPAVTQKIVRSTG